MSKTIDLQIEKSRLLIDGLRKNMNEVKDKGISESNLHEMEEELNCLKAANEECEKVRELLSQKVKQVNGILESAKTSFTDRKKTIKGYYPQEEWLRFGVTDKR